MTPVQIAARVSEIAMLNDDEMQHVAEKVLWESVLMAIADRQCTLPAACARAALETRKIKFSRWFA